MNFDKFSKSSNPMLSEEKLKRTIGGDTAIIDDNVISHAQTMTVSGAVNKTLVLGLILLMATFYSYTNPMQLFLPVGALGAAAVFMLTSFKPHLAPITAPIFAILEGLFVGTISMVYAAQFDGIIFQALSLTIGTLLSMLMIYKSGLIKVTKSFRTAVSMAVGAVMIVYLISWIGSFAGFTIPFIHESGPIGIGITVVIIGIAALNLLLDFDNFDKGEEMGAPLHFEWYFAMGLVFTLVWLFVEFLRLLSKLQSD